MRRILILSLLSLTPWLAMAQGFPAHLLDALNARQQGNGIEVSWTMSRGVTCLGIDVERSVNGSPYARVFRIGGVCGSPDEPETYRFSDENLNESGKYHYRLLFGSVGEASISAFFQQVWESGMSVLAVNGGHRLRVEGVLGSYDLRVYNTGGTLMYFRENLVQPTADLPTQGWPAGIYVVHVLGSQTLRQAFALIR